MKDINFLKKSLQTVFYCDIIKEKIVERLIMKLSLKKKEKVKIKEEKIKLKKKKSHNREDGVEFFFEIIDLIFELLEFIFD